MWVIVGSFYQLSSFDITRCFILQVIIVSLTILNALSFLVFGDTHSHHFSNTADSRMVACPL